MKRPDPPQPEKPVSEMTPKELAEFRTKLRREIRDRQVTTGTRRPRTQREMQIWMEANASRDARRNAREARTAQRQQHDEAASPALPRRWATAAATTVIAAQYRQGRRRRAPASRRRLSHLSPGLADVHKPRAEASLVTPRNRAEWEIFGLALGAATNRAADTPHRAASR